MNYWDWIKMDLPVAAAVIRVGKTWEIEKVNAEFVEVSGYTERELKTEKQKLIAARDRDRFETCLMHAGRGEAIGGQEIRLIRADHEQRWVEVRFGEPVSEKEGTFLVMVLWDIQPYKNVELKQQVIKQRYETMENISKEYPFDLDVEKWVMLRAHRLMELRGDYEAEDTYYPVDEEVKNLYLPDQDKFLNAMKAAAKEEMSGSVDTRFNVSGEGKTPRYMWFRTYYKSVRGENGKITRIVGRCFNIDTDKNLREEVRRDPLTKLLNKIEVKREISSFLEENQKGTHVMLVIDIDNFKGINDNFGHTFGDTVIVDVAKLIRGEFRSNDVVGRIGGDEFLVFMKNAALDKAVEKVRKLCDILSKEYVGGNLRYRISASIGMAVSSGEGSTYQKLFEQADSAMYRIKKGGKNGFEIANKEAMPPMPGHAHTIEPRESLSQEDQKFIAYAVSLMAHAKNLDGSLNMLLQRIADRYHLALVAILEWQQEKGAYAVSNYYSDSFALPEEMSFKNFPKELKQLEPGECTVLTMRQMAEYGNLDIFLNDKEAQSRTKGEFTTVIGRYEYVERHEGQIVYLSTEEGKQWSSLEMEMFGELTRILAVFASLRYRMDESEEQITDIQSKDQLTGLYNQETFRKKAAEILRHADPELTYAVEYMDINNFGYVNENYGYKVGDDILKMFAKDVSEQPYFRAGCRLYSDFFLLLIADENEQILEEHMWVRSQRFTNMQNHRYPNSGMGVTAGIYFVKGDEPDIEIAIENANLAWKHAKNENKRDLVLYDPKLRTERSEEQRVVGEFFEALYRDDFQMYLQPKFVLGERRIYGAEALARWKKPDGSILTPAGFIEPLEKIGYIKELDFYMFEEVLKTLDKWDCQKRRNIVVSTNFSGRHFDTDGDEFLSRIGKILSKYSVPPELVEIEVTESVLVKNVNVLEKCMKRLHEMGFRVAIDDFGTGYSSLSILADISADVIKIDKSFLDKNICGTKLSLLNEIGRMIRILKKDIIIEGVETADQERVLLNGGFVHGQGYLCNCPVPIGEFEKLYL